MYDSDVDSEDSDFLNGGERTDTESNSEDLADREDIESSDAKLKEYKQKLGV